MTSYDIAVGLDEAAMSQAMAAVYHQLYPDVFTGSQLVDKAGLVFDVSWDVTAPPTVALGPPPEGRRIVAQHLGAHLDPPPGVTVEQLVDAYVTTLEHTTFRVVADDMTMTIQGGGEHATVPVKVVLYVQVDSFGPHLRLRPLKATGTTGNPTDDWFLNNIILPEAIKVAQEFLPEIDLPPLTFAGVGLTAPAADVTPRHVVALAALAGRPVPTPPFPENWPQSPFFAVMSDEAKLAIGRAGVRSMVGRTFGDSGKVNIGIGTAEYAATARIAAIDIRLADQGAPQFAFNAAITGNVRAGITIGCTTFGLNYTLYAAPPPTGRIGLELSGTRVSARTQHVNPFVLLLSPDGNPIEWLLSALTAPLLQTVTAVFSPLITKAFEGLAFPVTTLPSLTLDTSGVRLVVTPADVRFATFAGRTSIEGTARITGG
ncbi:hypothetical protein AB0D13_13360 [Streptomyces sp. NPDC048430]|uniref:hypothetical protein n=1 Tax=unclassified Streptomyces TaxID=2593676 RepID=UPI00343E1D69